MTDVGAVGLDEFIASGRTGRRNALPDIRDEKLAATDTSSLPNDLAKLQCRDDDEATKSDTACADPQKRQETKTEDKGNS